MLIFDEVDSFLQERTKAQARWEVTQVNEMLTQMERFEGIFIATTNIIDDLDKASLRRFDLKLEFRPLRRKQATALFLRYCEKLGIVCKTPPLPSREFWRHLTPGDFAAVVRQHRFHPIADAEDFAQRLRGEVTVRSDKAAKRMGFV